MTFNPWDNGQITLEEAVWYALQQVPGWAIKAEIDTDNGILVYEVKVRTSYGDYEVKVDAYTGEILRVELD